MHKAMAALSRPIVAHKGDVYEIEEYEGSAKYEDYMRYMPANVALGASVFFLSFRDEIIESYPQIFTEGDVSSDAPASREQVFGRKWGWYQSIYAAAGGDVTKFNEVTKLPVHQIMTWLVFEKEKNELEAKRIKEAYR